MKKLLLHLFVLFTVIGSGTVATEVQAAEGDVEWSISRVMPANHWIIPSSIETFGSKVYVSGTFFKNEGSGPYVGKFLDVKNISDGSPAGYWESSMLWNFFNDMDVDTSGVYISGCELGTDTYAWPTIEKFDLSGAPVWKHKVSQTTGGAGFWALNCHYGAYGISVDATGFYVQYDMPFGVMGDYQRVIEKRDKNNPTTVLWSKTVASNYAGDEMKIDASGLYVPYTPVSFACAIEKRSLTTGNVIWGPKSLPGWILCSGSDFIAVHKTTALTLDTSGLYIAANKYLTLFGYPSTYQNQFFKKDLNTGDDLHSPILDAAASYPHDYYNINGTIAAMGDGVYVSRSNTVNSILERRNLVNGVTLWSKNIPLSGPSLLDYDSGSLYAARGSGNSVSGATALIIEKYGTTQVVSTCGSANGVEVSVAPTPIPATPPNNLCTAGTPSSVTIGVVSFDWTCDGPDGVPSSPDDVSCSAPKAPEPLSCTDQTTIIKDTEQAWSGSVYGTPQAIKKVGNYVYAGVTGNDDAQGLYIYDVSDPENIIQKSFFSVYNPASVRIHPWGNDVVGLDVVGNYAYLATDYGGLVIVDVSDPELPAYVSKLRLNNLNGASTKETWDVIVIGSYAYLAAGKGMMVVDVSDKANPIVRANMDLGGSISQEIHISGNYAYVAMRDKGFSILDISDPLNPVEISRVTVGYDSGTLAYALEKKGDILYVGENGAQRVSVYNVSNPTSPVLLGSVPVVISSGTGSPRELYIEGDVLYASAGNGGLYAFDITNPTSPVQLLRIDKPPLEVNAKVWGVVPLYGSDFTKLAIISGDTSVGLYTVEISCDPMPNLTSTFNPTGTFTEGVAIPLSGTVTNTGSLDTPTGFSDNFSYSWNGGTTWTNLPAIPHGVLTTGNTAIDSDSYLPNQVGTLMLQHCVDSFNEIDEGTNETPNCTQVTVTVSGATLTGAGCNIPIGGSTCDGTFTWNIIGASSPNLYNASTTNQYTTNSNGTNVNYPLKQGTNYIQARDGSNVFKQIQVSANCVAGSAWDGLVCQHIPPPPTITITANPNVIRSGQTAPVVIGIAAVYDMECTLLGSNLTPIDFTHTAGDGMKTYNFNTRPLKSTQMVQVTCTDGRGITETREARIEVLGTIQEI